MNSIELYEIYLQFPVISTDSRKITPDCIYFALKGENFNGNAFASQAIEKGAAYVVVDEELKGLPAHQVIRVKNVLESLQDLARHHRRKLVIPVLGITGSNGKTTTKELVRSVISQKYQTYATEGNLNNHIGVPLSILAVQKNTEFAIIEMGANHQQEIAFLCSICQPSCGLITNVGMAHLEGFGGFEGVKKGKKELYDFLKDHKGRAFIQSGSIDLMTMSKGISTKFLYGVREKDDISGSILESHPFLSIAWKPRGSAASYSVQTNLTGSYNFENVLAAVSIGWYFGLKPNQIKAGVEGYQPSNNRSQVQKSERNEMILDFYNANPSSMRAALDNFRDYPGETKMIILGDMFELGSESRAEHLKILDSLGSDLYKQKIFVGPQFSALKDGQANSHFFENTKEAQAYLQSLKPQGYTVLVKGSRGMQLEKVLQDL